MWQVRARCAAVRAAVSCLLDDLLRLVCDYDVDYRVLIGLVGDKRGENEVVSVNPVDGSRQTVLSKLDGVPTYIFGSSSVAVIDSVSEAHVYRRTMCVAGQALMPIGEIRRTRRREYVEPPWARDLLSYHFPLPKTGELCAICANGLLWRISVSPDGLRAQSEYDLRPWRIDNRILAALNADLQSIFLPDTDKRNGHRVMSGTTDVLELGGTDWHLVVVKGTRSARQEAVLSTAVVNFLTKTVASVEQIQLCDRCIPRIGIIYSPQIDVLYPIRTSDNNAAVFAHVLLGRTIKLVQAPALSDAPEISNTISNTVCNHSAFSGVLQKMHVDLHGCHAVSGTHLVLLATGPEWWQRSALVVVATRSHCAPTRYFTCGNDTVLAPVLQDAEVGRLLIFWSGFVKAMTNEGHCVASVVALDVEGLDLLMPLPDGAFGLTSKSQLSTWVLSCSGIPRISTVTKLGHLSPSFNSRCVVTTHSSA